MISPTDFLDGQNGAGINYFHNIQHIYPIIEYNYLDKISFNFLLTPDTDTDSYRYRYRYRYYMMNSIDR